MIFLLVFRVFLFLLILYTIITHYYYAASIRSNPGPDRRHDALSQTMSPFVPPSFVAIHNQLDPCRYFRPCMPYVAALEICFLEPGLYVQVINIDLSCRSLKRPVHGGILRSERERERGRRSLVGAGTLIYDTSNSKT